MSTIGRFVGRFLFVIALSLHAATGRAAPPTIGSPEGVRDAAAEAYVYGFPLVMNYKVFHDYFIDPASPAYRGPFNHIYSDARVYTPKDVGVQTPNSDTPYSVLGADLRAEPLVISVPKIEPNRFFNVQLVDMYTHNYGYISTRTTGNGGGRYLVAGPGWDGEAPAGIDGVHRCESPFSMVIFRTQLFGPEDIENVRRIQSGYTIQPLSAYLKQPAPPAPAPVEWPKAGPEVFGPAFASTLDVLLRMLPPVGPAAGEAPLRARMAAIGIGAGAAESHPALTPEQVAAIGEGFKQGIARIDEAVASFGTRVNGWQIGAAAGSRAFYNGDWLTRAVGSRAGIYGNDAEEATYPFAKADADGEPLDGSTHRYELTFAPGQFPPVRAFWSITMYDARTQLLVDNPINRYLINSPMLEQLKKNPDGSLTLFIQHDSPGAEREANWLPAPNGPIFMVMRLYWPRTEAPSALPPGKGSWAPPPIRKAGGTRADRIERTLRVGDKSKECVLLTDERYGHDALFQGPRGWPYWNDLPDPKPVQNPNLWPDTQSTYFLSHFTLPAGAELTLRTRFPHARYFQFALYKAERNTFVSIGEALSGPSIEPDEGAVNPFRVGADRHAMHRACTLRIVAADPPMDDSARTPNTMYVGAEGGELQGVIRIYLPDEGWDGAGWARLDDPSPASPFDYDVRLADGSLMSPADVGATLSKPMTSATRPPISAEQWAALVRAPTNDPSLDPSTAPAHPDPVWEKYWGIPYSILGAFKTSEERAKVSFGGAIDGGGDPSTQYFLTHLSRKFGPVYVLRGRMPEFPNTFAGAEGRGLGVTPEAQAQYWSIVSCEAAPSGRIVDGLCDMQIPLDENREYTIVYSRREDRPANATIENGVAWLEWSPRGEGLDHPQNREDFGMLMLRFMACDPDWAQSPVRVVRPGMEADVMGPYYPRGEYTTKAAFEADGPRSRETR